MAREKICGVYCIENLVNNKKYIGSSEDIYTRWAQHKRDLKRSAHHSPHLQNAWNNNDDSNFVFKIIECCSVEKKFDREQYWIDYYKTYDENYGYNIAKYVKQSGHANIEENLNDGKFKITRYEFDKLIYYLSETDIPIIEVSKVVNVSLYLIYSIYNHKAYNSLTKEISFIKRESWNANISSDQASMVVEMLKNGYSYDEINKTTGVSKTTISEIRNKRTFKHLTTNIIFPDIKVEHPNKKVSVNQYDKNGKYINTFKSLTEAAESVYEANLSGISVSCNDKELKHTCGGFYWKYFEDFKDCNDLVIPEYIDSKAKRIVMYSLDKKEIHRFKSISEASRYLKGNTSAISQISLCANEKISSAYGYIWRFAS